MPVAWVLLLVFLLDQSPAWSLPPVAPIQHVSSTRTLTGDELLRIGEMHDQQLHFRETLTYYELALSTYRERKHPRGIATVLVKIAHVYERQGRTHDAYKTIQEAVSLLATSSDRMGYARALLVIGRVAARLGHQDEARASLTQASALFNRAHDRRGWNEASIQLGLLQTGGDVPEQGLSLLQQAWEDAHARQDRSQELTALVALGNAQWLLDHTTEARRHYEAGLQLATADHNMVIEAVVRLRLAYFDGEDGQLNRGVESAKHVMILAKTLRDTDLEAAASSLLADLYRTMGQETAAEESAQRALSIYRHNQIQVHGAR